MISLSFNLSPDIKTCLTQIDDFRKEILLTPLTQTKLVELQWNARQAYLTSWESLLGKHRVSTAKLTIAFDHVRQAWTGSPVSVSTGVIAPLAKLLTSRDAAGSDTEKVLAYLDSDSIHPILQAAIAHLNFAPSPLACLVSLIYLARRGYDGNWMVCIDQFWPSHQNAYKNVLGQSQMAASITSWLEFYTQGALYQFGLTHTAVLHPSKETSRGIWALSDREKAILNVLEKPGTSITNRDVHKRFKISQVTASRDLAKLAALNLVYPHGHGRSTYYTRV